MDRDGPDGVASSSTVHLAAASAGTAPLSAAAGPAVVASTSSASAAAAAPAPTAAQQRKEARGRKRNDDLPPSRAREVQRAFRARRAAHLAALEERVREVEAENAVLRKELNLPPANREPIRAGPTGRGKILDPSSVASSPGGTAAGTSRSRTKRSATAAAGGGGDDFDDDSEGLGSADDDELAASNGGGRSGSGRPIKRQASDLARASPSLLASLNGGGSPADFGLLAGGGASGSRTPSIDPPGAMSSSGRPFASLNAALGGGGGGLPIHLTSPFPSSASTAGVGSPLLDHQTRTSNPHLQQQQLLHQQQQQQAAFLSSLSNGTGAFSGGGGGGHGGGSSPSALPPMTDEQIFFYQQHLVQQQAQNTAAAALAVANAKSNGGSGGGPSALGPFGFGSAGSGGGGGGGMYGASGGVGGSNGMASHGHSPLNTSFELLQQQQHALQQHQQQQHAAAQQQQQFHQHQQQQHHPLASLLAITTPQTMASSPYTAFSPSSFNSFSGPSSGGGVTNGLGSNSILGGLHSSGVNGGGGGGLRSHVSSPHSTHSSGFGPTPPATRPSFNETDAMFRLRMCCKLDDRLVSSDPGCLAFCQAVVSALGVTHADCLALPLDADEMPAIVGANGDSPGGGGGGNGPAGNGLGGGGLGGGVAGGFDPITPRSPLGKAAPGSHGGGGRYVPLLSVWAVLRPAFPLGHDGGIREAMEAGTRAARFLLRSAQDEARLALASGSGGGARQAGVQTQTQSGKPWACGEWIQCRSSNGVEVHTAFLQSLTERLADGGGGLQRSSLATGGGGLNGNGNITGKSTAGLQQQQQSAATTLSTPQTEPSPASTTHPSPRVPANGGGALGRPASDEERVLTGGGGGSSAIGPYGS